MESINVNNIIENNTNPDETVTNANNNNANNILTQSNETSQNTKKIIINKLFPQVENVNLKNLLIDEESMTYITTPQETKKIFNITIPHINKYKKISSCTAVDATGGAGGDTITCCQNFQSVISIEIDYQRYTYLKNNVEQYNFKNCTIMHGDSTTIIPKIQYCDVIYVDPPWGGSDYKTKSNLKLSLGDTEIETFILNCFDKDITISPPKVMVIKLPKNYNLKYLFERLKITLDVYLYELKKMIILVIEKKLC